MGLLKRIWRKIRRWIWWNFIAADDEKIFWQEIMYGTGIGRIVDGKRKFVDIRKFFKKLTP